MPPTDIGIGWIVPEASKNAWICAYAQKPTKSVRIQLPHARHDAHQMACI
jgi:hypothetical protein